MKIAMFISTILISILSSTAADYSIDFDNSKFVGENRSIKRIISLKKYSLSNRHLKQPNFALVFGPATFVKGYKDEALSISDANGNVELKIETGKYYSPVKGTIAFWISPSAKNFGKASSMKTLFEEKTDQGTISLYLGAKGNITAKYAVMKPTWVIKEKTEEEKFEDEKKDPEVLANEEVKKELKIRPHEIVVGGSSSTRTSKWKKDSWHHIAFSWNMEKRFMNIFIDGELRTSASFMQKSLSRSEYGKYLMFSPGYENIEASIDNIRILKKAIQDDFNPKKW